MNKWFQDESDLSNYDKFLIKREAEKKQTYVSEYKKFRPNPKRKKERTSRKQKSFKQLSLYQAN